MLRIEQLTKTYANGVQALRGVDLLIPTGMFGLLGPNGAGKSTLMRTIATLQEPDSGRIFLDDLDVLRERHEVRQRLGYLPQDFGVYPRVSAEELLDHLAILKGITAAQARRATVTRLLEMTHLQGVRKRHLGTFSGGMKQRFGIAQALLGDPKLIIVDEPTAGLDPEERHHFLNLLSAIGEHVVVILGSHIVEDVSELCTRMAILFQGKVLHTGKPQAAVAQLQGKIWQKTLDRGAPPLAPSDFKVLSSRLLGGQTIVHVFSEEHPGSGFEPVKADLKDVYFSTLKGWNPVSLNAVD